MTVAFAASLLGAALLGLALGLGFFGSLRWVIRRLPGTRAPALWLAGTATLRIGLVLLTFVLIGRGRWERFVAVLIGFLIARGLALHLWGGRSR